MEFVKIKKGEAERADHSGRGYILARDLALGERGLCQRAIFALIGARETSRSSLLRRGRGPARRLRSKAVFERMTATAARPRDAASNLRGQFAAPPTPAMISQLSHP